MSASRKIDLTQAGKTSRPNAALTALDRVQDRDDVTVLPTQRPDPAPAASSGPAKSSGRISVSGRVNADVMRSLRSHADGKRWGRFIEFHLDSLLDSADNTAAQLLRDAIDAENREIEVVERVAFSIRLRPEVVSKLESLAQSVECPNAVVLRQLLHQVNDRLDNAEPT